MEQILRRTGASRKQLSFAVINSRPERTIELNQGWTRILEKEDVRTNPRLVFSSQEMEMKAERYNAAVARHYAAYRPPLHAMILRRMLRPGERFETGLDIGCGTGYSTVALAKTCRRVYGVDPSDAMLRQAQQHPNISYVRGSGDELSSLGLPAVDVVTLAGALFYTKNPGFRQQLHSVCHKDTVLMIYDFEVLLDEIMTVAGLRGPAVGSGYNHEVNLSDWNEFACEVQGKEQLSLDVTNAQLAHIFLSDSNRYEEFTNRHPKVEPFEQLRQQLNSARQMSLKAAIYFFRYRMVVSGKEL